MAEEQNKEFTINVQFSGVEQDILGAFKQQVQDVAKSITLVNDTISEAAKVLDRVTKELKALNEGGGQISSVVSGVSSGGSAATHLATGQSRSTDGSDLARAVADLSRNVSSLGGGTSSLFGARGLTAGYRQWDQENSFEIPQFGPNSGFTKQDVIRQLGAMGGMGGYHSVKTGAPVSRSDLQTLHEQRENNPNHNIWRDQDYIEEAVDQVPWYLKPWKQQIGHAEGTSAYIGSLGEGFSPNNPKTSAVLQRMGYVAPYFAKGGAFNPGTYGLGLSNFRAHAAAIGNGYGRWDAQFGGDTTFSPFSDSGHQFFGAAGQAARNTWMGFNPFLSSKQAGEIQAAVAGAGYSGGTAESMRGMMSDVTQHTNIGIGDQAAIIDKSFRWGYANLRQLADFMKNDIPQAAQAARLNVHQFSQQLVQTATSLGQSTGTGFFKSAGILSDLSVGMGIDPGTGAQMVGDMGLTLLASTIRSHETHTPFSIGGLLNSPDAAGYYAEASATRVKQLTGIDANELPKLMRDAENRVPGAQAKLNALSTKLYLQQQAGVSVPGAGTLQEIARLSNRAIRDTKIAGDARTFEEQFNAKFSEGHDDYEQHHGGHDGGHSWLHTSLLNWGDKTGADAAGDARAAKWANTAFKGKQGRKDLIKEIMGLNHADKWDDSALGHILGHHDVQNHGNRGTHEVLGDSTRTYAQLMSALHKELARQTKIRTDKESKNASGKVIVSLGPGLQNLLKLAVAPGNTGYANGTGPAASVSDQTGDSVSVG